MNITEKNWQLTGGNTVYPPVRSGNNSAKPASVSGENSTRVSEKAPEKSGSPDSRLKSSTPDDSVGQLAAELSHAETKMDVLQVLSKATRALANLKMSAYTCDKKDAKKVAQMIRRMEKLIKRIQKKVKQLSKEEQLEIQQNKAEKQKKLEMAKQIREELRSRRNRRRREERNYAQKELAADAKDSLNETLSSVTASSMYNPQTALYGADGNIDLSAISADGLSVDITV